MGEKRWILYSVDNNQLSVVRGGGFMSEDQPSNKWKVTNQIIVSDKMIVIACEWLVEVLMNLGYVLFTENIFFAKFLGRILTRYWLYQMTQCLSGHHAGTHTETGSFPLSLLEHPLHIQQRTRLYLFVCLGGEEKEGGPRSIPEEHQWF